MIIKDEICLKGSEKSMEECQESSSCVKNTLEKILEAQKMSKKKECEACKTSCENSIDKLLHQECNHSKNTIPFILYCNCEPFKVEGVTTCFDECSHREKFICFTTFIFRIKDLKGECAVIELLKIKNHDHCSPYSNNQPCSLCCQLNCEDIDDLVATGVCLKVDLSCFCAIQCLPAASL
ncbi:CotY/CotZ family spore coat protein [Bacillus sp. CGMCC 1.16607]|uniref:CotY/CotZ family spore coat protein n=1 Tax=Bacillus sp. CGMCC 1.16607 TaxID=3351842 RepID=UPI0036365E0A